MRTHKAVVIAIVLISTSLANDFDAAALAGVQLAAVITPAVDISSGAIKSVYWVRHCNCRRQWVGTRRWVARRSWIPRERQPFWVSGCWRWRATHWGIGRVWSC
jgi:hypothetical protein